jgi:hypothetical protein
MRWIRKQFVEIYIRDHAYVVGNFLRMGGEGPLGDTSPHVEFFPRGIFSVPKGNFLQLLHRRYVENVLPGGDYTQFR